MKITAPAIGTIKTTLIASGILAACTAYATPATAQSTAQSTSPPSYATGEESIRGRISSFDGKYNLQVRDDRGFIDNVRLHDGTVINPTGLRLSTGQSVTILGRNRGKTFEANEIDTPYANYGGRGYGYGYGYAPYGYYPYAYRAYPAFGFGFRDRGFGVRGWY